MKKKTAEVTDRDIWWNTNDIVWEMYERQTEEDKDVILKELDDCRRRWHRSAKKTVEQVMCRDPFDVETWLMNVIGMRKYFDAMAVRGVAGDPCLRFRGCSKPDQYLAREERIAMRTGGGNG